MKSIGKNTMSCEHNTVKLNPGALRGNLTKIIKDFKGEKLYITKHNKLVAEINNTFLFVKDNADAD